MRRYIWPVLFIVAIVGTIIALSTVGLYTDWLWFKDLGYSTIFSTIFWTKIKIGLLMGIMFFGIIYGNLWYARKIAPPPSPMSMEQQLIERIGRIARSWIAILIFAASIIVSAMVGLEAATHWNEWLQFFNWTPFGVQDPVFHKDIGFYVFRLPLLSYVYYWLFFALAAAAIASILIHYAGEAIEMFGNRLQFAPKVKSHLGILIAAMFFLKAWGYRLAMYDLLFAQGKQFDGAGYTEIHASMPALWILMFIAIAGGLLVLYNISRRGISYAAVGLVGLIGASIFVGSAYPAFVEKWKVDPNERDVQAPYISRAIDATQRAYGLNQIAARDYAADTTLTPAQIDANSTTIENIRLWDKEHLQDALNQIQTIQQYYHFQDVDIDRYWLTDPTTGQKSYRQVWLAAREMAQSQLPARTQTWVNAHLQYTHGYGLAMSPVNEVSQEGLPKFFVYDIPPKTNADVQTGQMGVYFGELADNYALVRTNTPEFDYPSGDGTQTSTWDGGAGVRVGGFFRKLLFALSFSDINIMLNDNIKSQSRILYRREIRDRTEHLFKFLQFDNDPYLVTVKGKLYWMRDGYTMTAAIPYSKYVEWSDGSPINYIRNSVKVVIDAYTGHVDAYMADKPYKDPIIETYSKIFPGTFKPLSQMPQDLRQHIRYPEDMFRVQTAVYARYHYSKKDPNGFYNNGDFWGIPKKADLMGKNGDEGPLMDPYYVIMKLPNGKSEEFILMMPYIRAGNQRKNMVAWMCARSDGADYGKLVLYKFPENMNVYGPEQIVGRASQDTTISQQLTLWSQQGSTVGSGNLLVIPIDSSLLYVMPVYLVSTTTRIPELKRVIVALGTNIAMAPTLDEALSQVVGAPVSTPTMGAAPSLPVGSKPAAPRIPGLPPASSNPEVGRLIKQANDQYQKAVNAQKSGDWATYGDQIKALEKTLKDLQSKTGNQ